MMLVVGVILWCLLSGRSRGSDVALWGVHPNEVHLYDPTKEFKCKDGSMTLAFSKVNDDYCDCPDASDEPSTAACANGIFYCVNKEMRAKREYRSLIYAEGHVGLTLPSSRVQDGACDCCDGSDEFASGACVDDCAQRAEAARKEEEEKILNSVEEDEEEFRANLVRTGTRRQIEKLKKFRELELAKAEQEERFKELEEKTRLAEEFANAALDRYKTPDPEEKSEEKSKSEETINYEDQYVLDTFNTLDLDRNGVLDLFEVKDERIFDLDKNNRVEDREIKWYFDAMPGIANFEIFKKKMWKKMGRLFVLEKEMEKTFRFEFDWGKQPGEGGDEEETKRERMRKEKQRQREVRAEAAKIKEERERMQRSAEDIDEDDINFDEHAGEYDDKTKEAVLEAMHIREELNQAREKLEKLEKQKAWAEKNLYKPDTDADAEDPDVDVSEHLDNFGPAERSKYFPGRMHCYKYIDKHFQYKLCPFWGASQNDKIRQGAGIDLGRWVGWAKEKGEPIMVFKGGAACDNGVRRSTKARVFCGSRSSLVHVEEPRPCEYRMDFKTPAGCHIRHLKEANVTITSHDEL